MIIVLKMLFSSRSCVLNCFHQDESGHAEKAMEMFILTFR